MHHEELRVALKERGMPQQLIVLIVDRKTPSGQNMETEWFLTGKSVRKGCILPPYLFNLCVEHILRKTGLDSEEGVKTGGRNINNLSYADDIILLAESNSDLK